MDHFISPCFCIQSCGKHRGLFIISWKSGFQSCRGFYGTSAMESLFVSSRPYLSSLSLARPSFSSPSTRLSLRIRPRPRPLCSVFCSLEGQTRRWDSHDEDYLEARVLEAGSLVPSHGQLFMTLLDGREVQIDHINPGKGRLLYRSRTPTIFLDIEDDRDLLLPIVVGETAVATLMKGLRGDEKTGRRPNQFRLMEQIVSATNYEVQMVRVTERIVDTYYARIYIGKRGEEEMLSMDSRPSDAINLAVRCKVPIYVHKSIVAADAVKAVYVNAHGYESGRHSLPDCSVDGPDLIAKEITLMKNMLLAAVEERYSDAARWRDDLSKFRTSRRHIKQL